MRFSGFVRVLLALGFVSTTHAFAATAAKSAAKAKNIISSSVAQTDSGQDQSVQSEEIAPRALDALPEKKIEDTDLNEAAAKAIQDAASEIEAKAKTEQQNKEQAKTEQDSVKKALLKEADIPVLANYGPKKESIANPWTRIVFSFFVIAIAAAGLILFSRLYRRRARGVKENNKIRVLTQHFLGPRKSLAIIRVAGETILIGVTDHNISMLKSLALLDEDIPEATPQNFGQTLANAGGPTPDKAPHENLEDFVVSNVKDKVFSKLKNLRPL